MIATRGKALFAVAGLAFSIGLGAQAQDAPPNPARGRILFLRCASCHDISNQASMKIGPNLMGVVGRKAGSLPGYAYSPAMKAQTFTWTPEMLDRWLTKPDAAVPGTMMAFEGIPAKADRDAVIAYLMKQNH